MAIIRIKKLLLRTHIGFKQEEIDNKQDVIINMTIHVDLSNAIKDDAINDAYNYRTITKQVIAIVQDQKFHLLEKLAQCILDEIMANQDVRFAKVEVDKPHALRFAESVSVELEASRCE